MKGLSEFSRPGLPLGTDGAGAGVEAGLSFMALPSP